MPSNHKDKLASSSLPAEFSDEETLDVSRKVKTEGIRSKTFPTSLLDTEQSRVIAMSLLDEVLHHRHGIEGAIGYGNRGSFFDSYVKRENRIFKDGTAGLLMEYKYKRQILARTLQNKFAHMERYLSQFLEDNESRDDCPFPLILEKYSRIYDAEPSRKGKRVKCQNKRPGRTVERPTRCAPGADLLERQSLGKKSTNPLSPERLKRKSDRNRNREVSTKKAKNAATAASNIASTLGEEDSDFDEISLSSQETDIEVVSGGPRKNGKYVRCQNKRPGRTVKKPTLFVPGGVMPVRCPNKRPGRTVKKPTLFVPGADLLERQRRGGKGPTFREVSTKKAKNAASSIASTLGEEDSDFDEISLSSQETNIEVISGGPFKKGKPTRCKNKRPGRTVKKPTLFVPGADSLERQRRGKRGSSNTPSPERRKRKCIRKRYREASTKKSKNAAPAVSRVASTLGEEGSDLDEKSLSSQESNIEVIEARAEVETRREDKQGRSELRMLRIQALERGIERIASALMESELQTRKLKERMLKYEQKLDELLLE